MMEYKMFMLIICFMFIFFSRYFNWLFFLVVLLFNCVLLFPMSYDFSMNFIFLDSLSVSLVFLSIIMVFLMFIVTPLSYKSSTGTGIYYFLIFSFLPLMFYSFLSKSMIFFYFFFEASLVPTLFLITGWGYQIERVQATYYFLMYTIFASLPFLGVLLSLDTKFLFFDVLLKMKINFFSMLSEFLFLFILMMAFLVKMPLYLFHLWLPKAHVEAPVTGSMILAAVLLKLGGYGLIRLMNIFFLMKNLFYYLLILSSFSLMLIGLICTKLSDMKSLVAYSSVSHMGMALMGIWVFFYSSVNGSIMMFLSHGICSSGMFFLIGIIYNMSKSRSLMINKGLMNLIKTYSMFMFLIFMPNMAIPMTMNLFSEIYLLFGFLSYSVYPLIIIIVGMFMVAYFTMLIYSYTIHGNFNLLSSVFCNLSYDFFIISFVHAYLLNISFFVVNLF